MFSLQWRARTWRLTTWPWLRANRPPSAAEWRIMTTPSSSCSTPTGRPSTSETSDVSPGAKHSCPPREEVRLVRFQLSALMNWSLWCAYLSQRAGDRAWVPSSIILNYWRLQSAEVGWSKTPGLYVSLHLSDSFRSASIHREAGLRSSGLVSLLQFSTK